MSTHKLNNIPEQVKIGYLNKNGITIMHMKNKNYEEENS